MNVEGSGSGEVRSIQVCEFGVELGGMQEEEGAELSRCDNGVKTIRVVFGFALPLRMAEVVGVGVDESVILGNEDLASSSSLFRRRGGRGVERWSDRELFTWYTASYMPCFTASEMRRLKSSSCLVSSSVVLKATETR
jgi:hypothetical protein